MISNLSLTMDVFGLCILILICILSDIPSQILFSSPKKETSGVRSESVDFIRGLAITGIVFIHVNSYYQYFGPEKKRLRPDSGSFELFPIRSSDFYPFFRYFFKVHELDGLLEA